jgi:hypothetical protein
MTCLRSVGFLKKERHAMIANKDVICMWVCILIAFTLKFDLDLEYMTRKLKET